MECYSASFIVYDAPLRYMSQNERQIASSEIIPAISNAMTAGTLLPADVEAAHRISSPQRRPKIPGSPIVPPFGISWPGVASCRLTRMQSSATC
jgi:hypothetical protein